MKIQDKNTPKILVVNDYPLNGILESIKLGEVPDQFVYGVNHFLAAGWNVRIIDRKETPPGRIARMLSRILPVGHLGKQWTAWKSGGEFDLIYAPCQTQLQTLSYLRAFKLFRCPIVVLAHHPILSGRLHSFRARQLRTQAFGNDFFPTISRVVADEINGLAPGRSESLPWGPDMDFYRPRTELGTGIVTAGRTNRDLVTFGKAATIAGCKATIICLEDQVVPEFADFGRNVTVIALPRTRWMPYRELEKIVSQSRAVAIPLLEQPWLAGLSSLADAIGLGKPTIMTRNRCIDIDLEKERIGTWVAPGDVDGWVKVLNWYSANPDGLADMSERALALAANRFNSRRFAQRLMKGIEDVIESSRRE